jgi:hypothetical protein
VLLVVASAAGRLPPAWAQDADAPEAVEPSPGAALAVEQGRVADKYARLEKLMIRMSEIEAATNPQRAALLRRAVRQSSERLTRQHLNTITQFLAPPAKLKRALDEQEQVLEDMNSLLQLLLSENRPDRLKDEKARIAEYIKEVDRLIRLQRSVQGRTEGGEDAKRLAQDQAKVSDRTGELAQKIRENEEGQTGEEKPSAAEKSPDETNRDNEKPAGSKPGSESPPSPGKPGRQEQPRDSSQQPSPQPPQGKPGESQQQKPAGQPQQGRPPQGGQSPSKPPTPEKPGEENPARQRLEAAQQRMRDAQKKLEEAQRNEAVEEQEEARRELEKAKAELEEILRQLRDEEVGRTLAMLEARFRRMLEMQLRVYESTQRLDKIPAEQRGREVDIQASQLSFEENKLVVEADKALLLLREEGSSVAFPETIEQMRDDMVQVADLLAASKTGVVTQGYEEDIIASLEEMIEALQQAQEDLEEKKEKNKQKPQRKVSPEDMPLVSQLAEIKMIRSLQMRVNTRTQRYARMLENVDDPIGQAEDEDLIMALERLAEKQQRIHRVTRDIVLGKNK